MEKAERNSIDKKQNGLKYTKNDKSSTLPRTIILKKDPYTVIDIFKFELK